MITLLLMLLMYMTVIVLVVRAHRHGQLSVTSTHILFHRRPAKSSCGCRGAGIIEVVLAPRLVEAGTIQREVVAWLCADCCEPVEEPKAPKQPVTIARAPAFELASDESGYDCYDDAKGYHRASECYPCNATGVRREEWTHAQL